MDKQFVDGMDFPSELACELEGWSKFGFQQEGEKWDIIAKGWDSHDSMMIRLDIIRGSVLACIE